MADAKLAASCVPAHYYFNKEPPHSMYYVTT